MEAMTAMKKNSSKDVEQDPASAPSPQKNTDLPWTTGDIPTRKGNCNVLLIAPHGHPKNDGKHTRLVG